MNPRLFIKPDCSWCQKARRWLDDHAIAYKKIGVIADEAAFANRVRFSGHELAPVLVVAGKVLADFVREESAAFWEKNFSHA